MNGSEWLLVAGLALGGWFAFRSLRGMRRKAEACLPESMASCRLLVSLFAAMQQHRGMSSTYLSGEQVFLARMKQKQSEIEAIFPPLSASLRRESGLACPCLTVNELNVFVFNWKSLLDALPGLTVEQSMRRHTQLINQMLDWLAALGEARLAPFASTHAAQDSARNMTHRLPQLAECLGQARALGSVAAAQQRCSPVLRVRLMFLISRAESLLQQAAEHSADQIARQAVLDMASTVRLRILQGPRVSVGSADYFKLASEAIDRVFAWNAACAARVVDGRG